MKGPSKKTIAVALGEVLRHEYGDNITKQVATIKGLMTRANGYLTVDMALDNINAILKGYGTEAARDNGWNRYYQDIGLLYVNMGDTYITTVLYDTRKERFYVTSLGNIIESNQKRFGN
jgi:hypothetical protein